MEFRNVQVVHVAQVQAVEPRYQPIYTPALEPPPAGTLQARRCRIAEKTTFSDILLFADLALWVPSQRRAPFVRVWLSTGNVPCGCKRYSQLETIWARVRRVLRRRGEMANNLKNIRIKKWKIITGDQELSENIEFLENMRGQLFSAGPGAFSLPPSHAPASTGKSFRNPTATSRLLYTARSLTGSCIKIEVTRSLA